MADLSSLRSPQFLVLLLLNVSALAYWHTHLLGVVQPASRNDGAGRELRKRSEVSEAVVEAQDRNTTSVQVRALPQSRERKRRAEFGNRKHGSHRHGSAPRPAYDDGEWSSGHSMPSTEGYRRPPMGPMAATSSCEVCVATPDDPMCQEYGLDNVRLSRSYMGSGARVRKFLEKAMRGEKVKIGVIGGSVSFGHGIWPEHGEESWVQRFHRMFKQIFPNTEIENGSMPATGSEFFSLCWDAKIHNDADLYLVELEINDVYHDETYKHVDQLSRSILGLPQEPALIRVGTVATSFPNMLLGISAAITQSNYFDTPHITIRNWLLPFFMEHPSRSAEFFAVLPDGSPDYRHIAKYGHRALADMMTLYMREMICDVEKRQMYPVPQAASRWPQADLLGKIPRLYIWEPFSATKKAAPVHSFCSFYGSRRLIEPDPELTDPAWQRVEWNHKIATRCTKPGKQIGFRFTGTRVGLFVYMRDAFTQGKMECWTDHDKQRSVVIDAYWRQAARPEFHLVRDGLDFGEHTVSCRILPPDTSERGTEIRITGFAAN
ncbi:hypothetical protein ACM66B_000424 [Microbotryomycetes sp. NB124-2]